MDSDDGRESQSIRKYYGRSNYLNLQRNGMKENRKMAENSPPKTEQHHIEATNKNRYIINIIIALTNKKWRKAR